MATQQSDGSPAARGRASAHFSIREEADSKQESTMRQVSNVSLPAQFGVSRANSSHRLRSLGWQNTVSRLTKVQHLCLHPSSATCSPYQGQQMDPRFVTYCLHALLPVADDNRSPSSTRLPQTFRGKCNQDPWSHCWQSFLNNKH